MSLMLCAAMVVGVAAALVAPICYCKESRKSADNDDIVRPRIIVGEYKPAGPPQVPSRSRCQQQAEKEVPNSCERSEDSAESERVFRTDRRALVPGCRRKEESSADRKRRLGNFFLPWKRNRRAREGTKNHNNIDRNVSAKETSPNKRQSSVYKDSTSIGGVSSSSESSNCGVTEVVTVRIEAPPKCPVPSPRETPPNSHRQEADSVERESRKSSSTNKSTPLVKILLSKFHTYKRSLHRNNARDSTSSLKDTAENRTDCQTPVGHSTVLPKRRVTDGNKSSDPKPVNCLLLNHEESKKEGPKIIGLRVSQAELLSGMNDGHNTAIILAEEESIISIGFHEDRAVQEDFPASTGRAMQKLYRSLPAKFERVSISSFFRMQKRTQTPDSGIPNNSSDETSYICF